MAMSELDNIMAEIEDIMADLDAISRVQINEDKFYNQVVVPSDSVDNITIIDTSEMQSDSLNFSLESESDTSVDDTNLLKEYESDGVLDTNGLKSESSVVDDKIGLKSGSGSDGVDDDTNAFNCDQHCVEKSGIPSLPFDIDNIRFIDEGDDKSDEHGCDNEMVEQAIETIDRSDLDESTITQIINCQDINIDLSRAQIEPQLVFPETLPAVTRIILESRLILRQASAKLHLAIKIILVQAARQLRLCYRRIVMEQQGLMAEEGWTEELAAITGTRLMDVTERIVRMTVEFIKNASRDVVENAVDAIKDSVGSINDTRISGEAPEIEYTRL